MVLFTYYYRDAVPPTIPKSLAVLTNAGKMAFSHRGILGGGISGKALETGVCATASSGFLLFGYDREYTQASQGSGQRLTGAQRALSAVSLQSQCS